MLRPSPAGFLKPRDQHNLASADSVSCGSCTSSAFDTGVGSRGVASLATDATQTLLAAMSLDNKYRALLFAIAPIFQFLHANAAFAYQVSLARVIFALSFSISHFLLILIIPLDVSLALSLSLARALFFSLYLILSLSLSISQSFDAEFTCMTRCAPSTWSSRSRPSVATVRGSAIVVPRTRWTWHSAPTPAA